MFCYRHIVVSLYQPNIRLNTDHTDNLGATTLSWAVKQGNRYLRARIMDSYHSYPETSINLTRKKDIDYTVAYKCW